MYDKIVHDVVDYYADVPMLTESLHRKTLPKGHFEFTGEDWEWISILDQARELLTEKVIKGEIDFKALPPIEAKFEAYMASDMNTDWWGTYYHGDLNDHFDEKHSSNGDLIKSSVSMYAIQPGASRVVVDGLDCILYLWELQSAKYHIDGAGNSYLRNDRKGLIVSVRDNEDTHMRAFNYMKCKRAVL